MDFNNINQMNEPNDELPPTPSTQPKISLPTLDSRVFYSSYIQYIETILNNTDNLKPFIVELFKEVEKIKEENERKRKCIMM